MRVSRVYVLYNSSVMKLEVRTCVAFLSCGSGQRAMVCRARPTTVVAGQGLEVTVSYYGKRKPNDGGKGMARAVDTIGTVASDAVPTRGQGLGPTGYGRPNSCIGARRHGREP